MKNKKLLGGMLVLSGILAGMVFQPLISRDNIYDQMDKFNYIFNMALKNYVDEVNPNTLMESAIKGMLSELDPHSVYISADDMKSVDEDMQGSFDGIGVQFDILSDTITVISPIAGGPSEGVGIMAGDKIVKIDDENAVGMSRDNVPKKLRGKKGTIVKLDIFRRGNTKLISFDVVRDKIPLYSVDAKYLMEGSDIGVIVVNRFAATTYDELIQAAKDLKTQGMKKLVLDLRGNPGGYLNQAFMIADEFLPGEGDTIVYTKGRRDEFTEVFTAKRGNEFEELPLVVLINAGSASASEIVSGAIQDLDRGLIVGTTSFGKGLVQRQYKNPDGSAFRLTISRYYTPSGRSIQRPYNDKIGYRNLVGRLELEEGANIQHALEKIKKDLKKAKDDKQKDSMDPDSIPVFHTRNGRMVLGGGGITPDYIVKTDTLTDFGVDVRSKGVFNEFISNNLSSGKKYKEEYGNNFSKFYKEFKVTNEIMADFKKLAESKGVKWNEEQYKIDKDYIEITIKALLANAIWDRSRQAEVFSALDKQLMKAISLFPEAEKISKKRK